MTMDDRSKARGERLKSIAVNFLMPFVAFLVAQAVVVMAGLLGLALHPQSGVPMGLALSFAPAGALCLVLTIWSIQVWTRERDRLREQTGHREVGDVSAAFWRGTLIADSTVLALGVFILWLPGGGIPWELGLLLVVVGTLGILVTSYYMVQSRKNDRLPARDRPGA
jgi:hypothetical protein